METNPYALEAMVHERLTQARDEARRLDLLARARRARRPLRAWVGAGLIALGEWLRGDPMLAPAGRS